MASARGNHSVRRARLGYARTAAATAHRPRFAVVSDGQLQPTLMEVRSLSAWAGSELEPLRVFSGSSWPPVETGSWALLVLAKMSHGHPGSRVRSTHRKSTRAELVGVWLFGGDGLGPSTARTKGFLTAREGSHLGGSRAPWAAIASPLPDKGAACVGGARIRIGRWIRRLAPMCLIVAGLAGPSAARASSRWSAPTPFTPDFGPGLVSCASASFCVAIDAANSRTYDGTSWGAPISTGISGGAAGLTCPTRSFCVAVYGADAFVFNGSSWSTQALEDQHCAFGICEGGPGFDSVSCASASFCVAGDDSGNVFTYSGSAWTGPTNLFGGNANGSNDTVYVSCTSAAFCAAVDTSYQQDQSVAGVSARFYGGNSWSAATPVPLPLGAQSVSCGSASFCVAIDSVDASVYNGGSWTAPTDLPGGNANDISCPSSTFCVVGDGDGDVATYNGSSWGATNVDGLGLNVSCPSVSFCAAVDSGGSTFTDGSALLYSSALISPSSVVAPTLAQQGNGLFCSLGRFSGSPAPTLSDEWLRDGLPISGSHAPTFLIDYTDQFDEYFVRPADAGHTLTCAVTATNSAGQLTVRSNGIAIPGHGPQPPSSPIRLLPLYVGATLGSSEKYTVALMTFPKVRGKAAPASDFHVGLRWGDRSASRGAVSRVSFGLLDFLFPAPRCT